MILQSLGIHDCSAFYSTLLSFLFLRYLVLAERLELPVVKKEQVEIPESAKKSGISRGVEEKLMQNLPHTMGLGLSP